MGGKTLGRYLLLFRAISCNTGRSTRTNLQYIAWVLSAKSDLFTTLQHK